MSTPTDKQVEARNLNWFLHSLRGARSAFSPKNMALLTVPEYQQALEIDACLTNLIHNITKRRNNDAKRSK